MKVFLGVIMTVFYLLIAFLLFFSDVFNMQEVFKIILGIIFFIYGLFRGYRVWKIYN